MGQIDKDLSGPEKVERTSYFSEPERNVEHTYAAYPSWGILWNRHSINFDNLAIISRGSAQANDKTNRAGTSVNISPNKLHCSLVPLSDEAEIDYYV